MKLKSLFLLSALLGAFISGASAQEELAMDILTIDDVLKVLEPASMQNKMLTRAKIRVLEFSSNKLIDLDLTENDPVKYKELTILLKACRPNQSNTQGKDVAWLEISEPNKFEEKQEDISDKAQTLPTFAGWMFNTLTDISTLDHPKYDVRLLKCLEPIEIQTLEVEPTEIDAPEVEELPNNIIK